MLPKTGKVFPRRVRDDRAGDDYAVVIGAALREELGNTHQSIKTVMGWTGASERTVKNWLAGASGPSGEHLIGIVQHSDTAFAAVMVLAGRDYALAAKKLIDARNTLAAMLEIIVSLTS